MQEPTITNVIPPNRPHATSLQVEEIGSFTFTSHDESVTYETVDGSGKPLHGVIEEGESDGEMSISHKKISSRGVSIMSASEDETSFRSGMLSREVSIDEVQKDMVLDEGAIKVKISERKSETLETFVGEMEGAERVSKKDLSDENEAKKKRGRLLETAESEHVPEVDGSRRKSGVETDESRKPRRGTLIADVESEVNGDEDVFATFTADQEDKAVESKTVRLLKKEKAQQEGTESDSLKLKIFDVAEEDGEPQKGKRMEVKKTESVDEDHRSKLQEAAEDTGDKSVDELLKRVERQRSALGEILDKQQEIKQEGIQRFNKRIIILISVE